MNTGGVQRRIVGVEEVEESGEELSDAEFDQALRVQSCCGRSMRWLGQNWQACTGASLMLLGVAHGVCRVGMNLCYDANLNPLSIVTIVPLVLGIKLYVGN